MNREGITEEVVRVVAFTDVLAFNHFSMYKRRTGIQNERGKVDVVDKELGEPFVEDSIDLLAYFSGNACTSLFFV